MFNGKDEFIIDGVAQDVDTLFRIRDYLVDLAMDEISHEGYAAIDNFPIADWTKETDGNLKFSLRWKVRPVGED